jgi:hypothetical protein
MLGTGGQSQVKVEGKVALCFIHRVLRHEDEWESRIPPFLTSVLDGCEWSVLRPFRITPRERSPSTHWIGGWMMPEQVLTLWNRCKSLTTAGNRTPDFQPAVRRYTDWATRLRGQSQVLPMNQTRKVKKILVTFVGCLNSLWLIFVQKTAFRKYVQQTKLVRRYMKYGCFCLK